MSALGLVALLLLAVGLATSVPALLVVGLALGLVEGLRLLWARRGLVGVEYSREIGARSAVWGDEIPLRLLVRNRKLLPLPWLSADDLVSEDAVVRERPLSRSDRPGLAVMRNGWTLGPYERVTRTLHILAQKRGRFEFEAVRLRVADLFAGGSAAEERRASTVYLVAPRSVPLLTASARTPLNPHERRARGLNEDAALFAGLRSYQREDPPRRIHWKATARTGRPLSKRFDPSQQRETLVALDIQTLPGPHWVLSYEEELVEMLCVAAASLVRHGIEAGESSGLAVAAYSGSPRSQVRIRPAAGPAHLLRMTDALARISPFPSAPFESLLAGIPPWLSGRAAVRTVSARLPEPYLPVLRRIRAQGIDVEHFALGRDARAAARMVRAAGLPARIARLDPDWRTCSALDLAG